jgi:calmodulin
MANTSETGMSQLRAENAELIEKLLGTLPDGQEQEDVMRQINYTLRNKLVKQQKATGEPVDSVGLSPKERAQFKEVFDKNADANGVLQAANLKKLVEEIAEPFTDEEIDQGMQVLDKDGNGVIDFNEFCKWMEEEREKDGHQGLKISMLKMKLRAAKFKNEVESGLKKTPSLPSEYQSAPENLCRISHKVTQGQLAEPKTLFNLAYESTNADAGRALMDAAGCAADGKACVCVSIAMLEGTEGCNDELVAIYEQVFDMATENGQLFEEKQQEMFLQGKPTVRVVVEDGKPLLQLLVSFTQDPFTDYLNVDSRYLKTLEAQAKWAHQIDEVLKEDGEEIDLLGMDGLEVQFKSEADRQLLEWLAASPELSEMVNDNPEAASMIAGALAFGSFDSSATVRSATDILNPVIRENLESYGEFADMLDDRRMIPAEMIGGVTDRIVEMYCRMPDPLKNIYGELKSKIAGPVRVEGITPTANMKLTASGLECVYKFFPTVAEIESHPAYEADGSEEEDMEW